ncbi:MAG: hypothetical protein ACKVZJ_12025 [Phycisphaerales bacterium]
MRRLSRSIVPWAAVVGVVAGCLARAGAQGGAPERAPLDPASAVGELRKAYHKRPFVEALEITIEAPGSRRRESVTVRGNVKGELRLDLGELHVWTDGPVLRAVHRLNAGTYFEAALDGADRAAAFLAALPPLPVPQVGLVLQPRDAKAASWMPSPTCVGLAWESAIAASHGRKPAVVLSGSAEACSARVAAVGSPPVLTFVETKSERDGVTTTVTARIERLEELVGKLDADLRGRERVAALSELRAVTPDVRAGLAMPELIVEPVRRGEGRSRPPLTAGRPCVLLLFVPGDEAGETFVRGAHAAATAGGVDVRLIVACSLTEPKLRQRGVGLMNDLEAGAGFVSYSPGTTLGRFVGAGVTAAGVVVDGQGLVRAVVSGGDGAGAVEEIRRGVEGLK